MPFFGSLGSFVTLAILVVTKILNAVTTLAGTGVAGFAESPAQFSTPYGVATDWDGNVYVADSANQRIRKITPAGVTTVFAGSGTAQFADGTGTNASFNYPYAVAVDSLQNVYVSDSINYRIRKITPAGVVTTLAGSGTAATTNGTGGGASFNLPRGITVDLSGNVYVSEQNGNVIRKITSGGVVTTLAGIAGTTGSTDATGTSASFNKPFGVVADSFGNVYVSDTYNHRIRRITSDGIVTTLAGSTVGFADGTGTNAKFNFPETMSIDPLGVLYVAEETGERIRKINPSTGVVTTLAGTGTAGFDNGTALQATFRDPHGIAVDRFRQAYVGDRNNHSIRKIADVYTLPDNNGVVTTVAGDGTGAFLDGTGIGARFNGPYGVTVNSTGIMYVADIFNSRIRTITPAGVVTTFAGSGTSAFADGTGTNASFSSPTGIALDSSGNVYVVDSGNYRIRKITATGVVTTLAGGGGSPAYGYVDGTGTNAKFRDPYGVAVDSVGNVYISDASNSRIRKITPAGVVTTLAGSGSIGSSDGTGTNATFNFPWGIAVDSAGNLYISDQQNNNIRKITPAGVVTTLAGQTTAGYADGTGTNASFRNPSVITVDSTGTLYLSDSGNNRIRKITSGGVVTTLAGSGTTTFANGTGTNASIWNPIGITVDSGGIVYVGDTGNQRIRKIGSGTVQLPLNRGVVTTIAGNGTTTFTDGTGTNATFNTPVSIAFDPTGIAYVGDYVNNRIRRIAPGGVVTTFAGSATAGFVDATGTTARFRNPYGVAVDSGGNLYVADHLNHRIRKITPAGVVTTFAGSGSGQGTVTGTFVDGIGTNAGFSRPVGVAIDLFQNVYVSDRGNNCIRKITPAGVVTTFAGFSGSSGSADGIGTNAQFNTVNGITVDSFGNVYVPDGGNNCIRRITPEAVVTRFAGGTGAVFGFQDGTGTNAIFNFPYALACDSMNNIYVADYFNYNVRRITPAGVVNTLAGSAGSSGFADGTGTDARFATQEGIVVDSGGILYLADTNNHRIRKIS